MCDTPAFEITVTGLEGREWQGTVYFPASGTRQPFQSLMELLHAVEETLPPPERAPHTPED